MSWRSSSARASRPGFVLACLLLATPVLAVDQDGDGYHVADGDCADVPSAAIPLPQYVNPGAYDAPGNGIDDDCDGTIDNPASSACSAGSMFGGQTGMTLAQALDLCQATVESPATPAQRTWGVISAQILRASSPGTPGGLQSAVMVQYGGSILPQGNATMAVISSGTARDQNDVGYINPEGSGYSSGSLESPPANFLAGNGGSVYGAPGCPIPGNQAYDGVRLKLRLRVPSNANGFSFKHRFFSAEWPDVCTPFNDHFVGLLTSGHPSTPANHNILFEGSGNPATVHTAVFEHCSTCPQGMAELSGTGYGQGAGTSWHTSSAPVVPGETIELEFVIWDSQDSGADALALLDDFRWATVEQPVVEEPESPLIRWVRDVKPDQGGAVRIRWRADLRESPGSDPQVTGYTLYRRVDGASALAADPRTRAQGEAALLLPPGEWDVLNSFPATLDSAYQTVAPTLCDSTAEGPCWSVFFVRAITGQVGTFHDSPLDSGSSVDDIAPGVPQGFAALPGAGGMQLSWQPSGAHDFQYVRVHRGTDPGFVPGPSTLVHSTAGTSWADPAPGAWTWKLTAVDAHGNESAPATVSATVGVGDAPLAFALEAARPNPMAGSSRLAVSFALPVEAPASLELVDVRGRVIASRAVGALGAGRHRIELAPARTLPAGIYLVRLTQGAHRRASRVVVLD